MSPDAPTPQTICAVIVTFNPSLVFRDCLFSLRGQVARIIIVDNASARENRHWAIKAARAVEAIWIQNSTNRGIAAALNQGVRRAWSMGFSWVLTLDQDSQPTEGMVEQLCASFQRDQDPERLFIVAPRIVERYWGLEISHIERRGLFRFTRVKCSGADLARVTTTISSGSLINIEILDELGGFREDFFIDHVDTEICLRAITRGYNIRVACDAVLLHQLGHRKKVHWGPFTFFPTYHPPERWFTFSRNRIPLIRRYGRKVPHWLLFELLVMCYTLLRMLLTERDRLKKLRAFLLGTLAGLQNQMGPPPWAAPEEPDVLQAVAD